MAYTIIEVERQTGIASRTLRFWASKGLFPALQKDSNNIRYFSKKDVEWACWINCFREMGMSIDELRQYIELAELGDETIMERRDMIVRQKQNVLEEISRLHTILGVIDRKIAYYDEMHSIQMLGNNESEALQGPVLTASEEYETLYKVAKPRSFRKYNERLHAHIAN
ncbi:MerR family transcriptional regulator [Helicobacter sp. MIT 00-7814]|uniref:MerR family transcriptional regulator n=1 Tax=unclassified Helicobacter TaxID=2593540 RepID=UPI000E1E39D7|nr:MULTISPECIES: MerR family transcriptional regulator [unclassified Helicobacter]RDU53297.1 MerR family transcriptional regulator [Helicobacter sp. MIT 99-10781]RDU56950.1 MerR family transcriptional regulator [Helicobacter sp. MIT 00-7814]